MEKNTNYYKKVELPLEKFPQFGTICSEVDNTKYFVPLTPNEKQRSEIRSSFICIEPNYYKKETFYIYMKMSDEENNGTLKIELRLRNIESVETQSFRRDDTGEVEQTLYFYLVSVPKIFRKVNQFSKVKPEENFVQNFTNILDSFSFTNHYHLEYPRVNKFGHQTIIKENSLVEHGKNVTGKSNSKSTQNSDEEISFDIQDESEYQNFVRVDSYLSLKPEFINFYLLNLVMKIKIKFQSEEEADSFVQELRLRNIAKEQKTVHSVPDAETNMEVDCFLRRKTKQFYKIFLNLHFNLQYSILSLITQKRLNIFSFDMELLKKLEKISCGEQNNAAIIIEQMIKEQNLTSKLSAIFDAHLSQSFKNEFLVTDDKEKQNKDIMKTRTIEVTPSLIFYKPPMFEKINHILRKYDEYKENFVKVNFVDEENNKIFFSSQTMWIMINFLKNVMLQGITIGSRLFEFLSASNSQMKNSSYWFICLEGTRFIEVEQIIRELGDFSKETNIHKNAARRGQCLSTTSFIKKLSPSSIKLIDDVERNGYCFTDGIGMISLDLALECARNFKLNYASAFQIRIGGIKGIIAVNPDIKEKEAICVRPSMTKFESPDTELGVIRCSNFSQGYLNRQIIILLSTLGVPHEIFLNMLSKDLSKYNELIDNPNAVLSKTHNMGDLLRKCYFFLPYLNYYCNNKLEIKNEPFISSLVLNLAISKIIDLKNKGKIIDKFSAVLIGVIDETNTLEEGEVFVQIKRENFKDKSNPESFVLNSKIIVTKNPCLHPGDIKILLAVNDNNKYEKLAHMVNVIVFSSKGRRPIQNEISGGDLDGDSYHISWNENLINNIRAKNVRSMEETKGMGGGIKTKDIKMKDIINSYIEYMKNDTIALISNAHSAYADNDLERGAYSKECLKLAEMFAIAIDAPKHGNFITHEDFKKYGLQFKQSPDFLENPTLPSYESPGILGQLYRLINVNKYLNQFEHNEYNFNYLENYLMERSFISDNSYKYCIDAYRIYKQYQNEIKTLMSAGKVLYETEFFLCEDLHSKKRNKQLKQNDIFTELNNLKDKYRNIILNTFTNSNDGDLNFDMASAFYVVTYLNDKSLNKFYGLFCPKFNELINVMKKDGRLDNHEEDGGNNMRWNFNNYNDYKSFIDQKKEYKGFNEIIKHKRIFSLPWVIKEVRDRLFKNKFYNY